MIMIIRTRERQNCLMHRNAVRSERTKKIVRSNICESEPDRKDIPGEIKNTKIAANTRGENGRER